MSAARRSNPTFFRSPVTCSVRAATAAALVRRRRRSRRTISKSRSPDRRRRDATTTPHRVRSTLRSSRRRAAASSSGRRRRLRRGSVSSWTWRRSARLVPYRSGWRSRSANVDRRRPTTVLLSSPPPGDESIRLPVPTRPRAATTRRQLSASTTATAAT